MRYSLTVASRLVFAGLLTACGLVVERAAADDLRIVEIGGRGTSALNDRGSQLESLLQGDGFDESRSSTVERLRAEAKALVPPTSVIPEPDFGSDVDLIGAHKLSCEKCFSEEVETMVRKRATSVGSGGRHFVVSEVLEGDSGFFTVVKNFNWSLGEFQDFEEALDGNPRSFVNMSEERGALIGTQRQADTTLTMGRLSILSSVNESRPRVEFEQLFTPPNGERSGFVDGVFLQETNELLVVGVSGSEMWLVKFDLTLNDTLWERSYDLNEFIAPSAADDGSGVYPTTDGVQRGIDLILEPSQIAQTLSGDFIVVGSVRNLQAPNADESDLLIVKIDVAGDIGWARACGGTESDFGTDVVVAPTGEILVGGGTRSKRKDKGGVGWILKFDAAGFLNWEGEVGSAYLRKVGLESDLKNVVVDAFWRVYSIEIGKELNHCAKNWDGESSWTQSAPFVNRSRDLCVIEQSPALTCTDILYRPTLDEMLANDGRFDFKSLVDTRIPRE